MTDANHWEWWMRAGRPDPAWWFTLSADDQEACAVAADAVFSDRLAEVVVAVATAIGVKPRAQVVEQDNEDDGEDVAIEAAIEHNARVAHATAGRV